MAIDHKFVEQAEFVRWWQGAVRDQIDHLIGLVDKELRVTLASAARNEKVAELHKAGLSQRQIAAAVGVDVATVNRGLNPRSVVEHAKKIREDGKPSLQLASKVACSRQGPLSGMESNAGEEQRYSSTSARSLFSPVATIRSKSFANGLCSEIACSSEPSSQTSHSSSVAKITGMALACIGRTMAFDSVVRNAKS
jgi:hypothetical protein